MKTIAAFFLVNAAIFATQAIAAGAAVGFGHMVIALGAGESWLAWALAGILAAGGAISVAARLAMLVRG